MELGRHCDTTSMLQMGKLRFREERQVARVLQKGSAELGPFTHLLYIKMWSASPRHKLEVPNPLECCHEACRGGVPAPFDKVARWLLPGSHSEEVGS